MPLDDFDDCEKIRPGSFAQRKIVFQNTLSLISRFFNSERAMGILRLPGRLYDQVYASYGWFGVAFAILGIVVGIIGIMIWFDRRR